jgi:hypothetical protein
MRDVTGEYLLSKVDPLEGAAGELPAEKMIYSNRMNLPAYRKSLVFVSGINKKEARERETTGGRIAENGLLRGTSAVVNLSRNQPHPMVCEP